RREAEGCQVLAQHRVGLVSVEALELGPRVGVDRGAVLARGDASLLVAHASFQRADVLDRALRVVPYAAGRIAAHRIVLGHEPDPDAWRANHASFVGPLLPGQEPQERALAHAVRAPQPDAHAGRQAHVPPMPERVALARALQPDA